MTGKTPLHVETGRRFGDGRYVRPRVDCDGVGYALRAIYDHSPQSRTIPEDFSSLLQRLG